jgi:preprotein translocase subunit SecD
VRDGAAAEDVLPLKDGEALAVDRHRYAKGAGGPPRYLVVRSAPAAALDLDGEPEAITAGAEVVGVRLKLKPAAAAALERLTRDQVGRQVAVVVGGEVVTAHKVRDPIRGGQVQVTGCAPGSAGYLLGQLKSRPKGR